jgi:hypothetical protein
VVEWPQSGYTGSPTSRSRGLDRLGYRRAGELHAQEDLGLDAARGKLARDGPRLGTALPIERRTADLPVLLDEAGGTPDRQLVDSLLELLLRQTRLEARVGGEDALQIGHHLLQAGGLRLAEIEQDDTDHSAVPLARV